MLTRVFFANEILQRELSLNKNSVMVVNRRQEPVSDLCKSQKYSGLHPKYYLRNNNDPRSNDPRFMHELCKHAYFI